MLARALANDGKEGHDRIAFEPVATLLRSAALAPEARGVGKALFANALWTKVAAVRGGISCISALLAVRP